MQQEIQQSCKSKASYTQTRYNALKHGALSRVPVLPWESEEAFNQLQESLTNEYQPQGASEEHLVLEMANCIFRKQRIYQAENALIMEHMTRSSSYFLKKAGNLFVPESDLENQEDNQLDLRPILHYTPEDDTDTNPEHRQYLEDVQTVMESDCSYEEMLKECPDAAIDLWNDWLKDRDCGYCRTKESFKEFLKREIIGYCGDQARLAKARPYLRQQMIGLSYEPTKSKDSLQRHETTLDRRFEKTLAMLLKLQEVRSMKASGFDTAANSVL